VRIVLGFFAAIVFVLATVAATGARLPLPIAALLGVAVAVAGWVIADRRRLGVELPKNRVLRGVWIALAILAVVQTVRLGMFTVNPNRAGASATPWSPFVTNHSCATAYFEASRFAKQGEPNVYTPKLYTPTPAGRFIDRFRVDRYEYPPPFLLLPGVFATQDFLRFRSL